MKRDEKSIISNKNNISEDIFRPENSEDEEIDLTNISVKLRDTFLHVLNEIIELINTIKKKEIKNKDKLSVLKEKYILFLEGLLTIIIKSRSRGFYLGIILIIFAVMFAAIN